MSTYAVGDIQGCLAPLKALLADVRFDPKKDHLWCAGDLVNRGPDSLDTLRFLQSLGTSVTCVLGNHDLHLLALAYATKPRRIDASLTALLNAPDKDQLLNWLCQWPLFYHDSELDFSMVHAGIPPQWSTAQCIEYSREVEQHIQSSSAQRTLFLDNLYGDFPTQWNNKLQGFDRLRLIVNYFTRMRFCDANGTLELQTKNSPQDAPSGFSPWFSFKRNNMKSGLIFGHWAALEGRTKKHQYDKNDTQLFALDTGCVWGGHLTLLNLETHQLTQSK